MRVIRKLGFLVLLLAATLFVQNAAATLAYLPDSSYAEAEGNWQGRRIYKDEDDGFDVLIDFTVYDTGNLQLAGESALADELDMAGQYIYAYQMFNHPGDYEDVGYFQILNLDGTSIAQALDDIGSHDDASGGVAPTDTSPEGVWKFGLGVLVAGKHSYFLIFSSDSAPIPGSYEIGGIEEEGEYFPGVPEPGMLTLLGIGGALMFTRRRKSA